jgi:ribosomal protein L22
MGNAKNRSMSPADLAVKSLQIMEGPRYKRRDGHAHGARFDSGVRHKKMLHIMLELANTKEANGAKG